MGEEYFSWLALDATNEEFENEVNSVVERDNNTWVLDQVDRNLRDLMDVLKNMINEASAEEVEDLLRDVSQISIKLGILRSLMDAYQDNLNMSEELEKDPGEVKVVYAKNFFGNVMCINDFSVIKNYVDEKYELLMSLLDKLYNGDTNFNTEKQRPLTSSNKLKGIYELKEFKIRLIYMREGEYTVVLGALVKKDDNDKKYRSTLENMKKQSERYRQAIRSGKTDMDLELALAQEIRESFSQGVRRGK